MLTFNFTVTATDANNCTGTNGYSITITCGSITLDDVLPDGNLGIPYNSTITASGGTPDYVYAVTSGALPDGLTLSPGGALSGTPSANGAFNFVVTATDLNGCTGTRSYSITITCPAIALDDTLPDGSVGSAYSGSITAFGGPGPFEYNLTAGALPTGLTLDLDGSLTGTPTTRYTILIVISLDA